jgi:hypothetical protein
LYHILRFKAHEHMFRLETGPDIALHLSLPGESCIRGVVTRRLKTCTTILVHPLTARGTERPLIV